MKRFLSVVLAFSLLLTTCCVGASADVLFGANANYIGNLDDDMGITAADALSVLRYTVGKQKFTDFQVTLGDVNADGGVNAGDALDILRKVVGRIDCFEAGNLGDAYTLSDYEYADPFATYKPYKENDFDYNTSLSVNGAYADDTTADCSFVMDNTGLQPKTIYQLTNEVLVNVDVSRFVYSLQGLINRDFGRDAQHTSLIYVSTETSDAGWLEFMQNEGSVYAGYEKVRINSWDEFYATFKTQIELCGMILWDGNVPATANVAATICGVDGYLPVLAKSPLHNELKEKGLAEKQSLVGLFKNGNRGQKIADSNAISTGSAKNDAYLWALEKYFPRCSSNYLAYILDGAVTLKGYEAYEDNPFSLMYNSRLNSLPNHDYLIARRCFFFDLHPYKEETCDDSAQRETVYYPCPACGVSDHYDWDTLLGDDDPVCAKCNTSFIIDWDYVHENNLLGSMAEVGEDQNTMLKIFQARYDRAGGAMGQLMGFPPWWVKYTQDVEQGSKAATWIEWLYCELISCYNMAKEADAAGTVSMTNGSVYYKYVPLKASYDNNFEEYDPGFTYDDETTYFTLYMGDYDSSAWLKNYAFSFFMDGGGDKTRASLPLTWCFNPNLSLRIPMVFEYVYANKYEHEFFAAGDSGAGYVIPASLFGGTNLAYAERPRPEGNQNGDRMWAEYCKGFYERFDMQVTGFIINGSNAMTTDIMGMFNTFATRGSLHNCGHALMTQYKGVPYVYCQNGIDQNTDLGILYNHAFETMGDYKFAAYRTVCVSPSNAKKIVDNFTAYATEKGDKIQYVELNTFLKFAKESGRGCVVK